MGGINHQPCNRPGTLYLPISTRMSREFTAGRAHFELANVSLEDAILQELGGNSNSTEAYRSCLELLKKSEIHLIGALVQTDELEQEMKVKGYEPLPAFALYRQPEAMEQIGNDLAAAGLLRKDAFDQIAHPQLDGGFYGALKLLRETIGTIRDAVLQLRMDMENGADLAENSLVAEELETNGPLNFRTSFMRAYALWGKGYDQFLASATFSTELWYQSTGAGSLLQEQPSEQRSVA